MTKDDEEKALPQWTQYGRSHSHYKRNRKIKDTEAKPFLNSKMMIMMEHQVFFFIIKRTRRSIPSQKRTGRSIPSQREQDYMNSNWSQRDDHHKAGSGFCIRKMRWWWWWWWGTLMLKGPGLILTPPIVQSGSTEAMNWPRYNDTICPAIPDMVMGAVLKWKNWFTNDKKMHKKVPMTHVRNVSPGIDGSSVSGTVNFTSSICEASSSSEDVVRVVSSGSGIRSSWSFAAAAAGGGGDELLMPNKGSHQLMSFSSFAIWKKQQHQQQYQQDFVFYIDQSFFRELDGRWDWSAPPFPPTTSSSHNPKPVTTWQLLSIKDGSSSGFCLSTTM